MADIAEVEQLDSSREGRSPGFPFIPLRRALERAKALRQKAKGNEARTVTAASAWEYGIKSSGLRQTIAALKHFGLIDYIGTGAERKIKLTEMANRIVLDERADSPERDALIKKAALTPKIFAELWEHWHGELPDDVEIRAELTLDRGFSQSGAAEAVMVFKQSLAFAKLISEDEMPEQESDILETQTSHAQSGNPKVAPLVPRASQQPTIEERIVFKPGQEISLRFASEPDAYTYKSLIAYLDFRLKQIEKSDK